MMEERNTTPIDPYNSETARSQLDFAREQGKAYGSALDYMNVTAAHDGGGQEVVGRYEWAGVEFVVAKNEKSIWPFYHPVLVFRTKYLNDHQKAAKIANEVADTLTLETMQRLNGEFDLQHKAPEDVARGYLEQKGLI